MDFAQLHRRLVSHLQRLVRNGEITERGLSRLTGVSQPHIHNVLKGKRLFSLSKADDILKQLHLDLFDLLEPHELREGARR